MGAIREADLWVGKTLFVPIIVRVCQATRQSQYAVARALWLTAGLWILYHAEGWLDRVLTALLCLLLMFSAGLRADLPRLSLLGFRVLWWVLLIIDLLAWIEGKREHFPLSDILILFAEYAATITTIPPRDTRKRRFEAGEAAGR
ncbi:hypothetical protein KFK14_19660 [Sphingobium phenoxybenzoativorans]|uniref:Uncharacterized protein n=1 Tax=Sphingobium phenoxybenzoativorans TaxID=1592790 RepID=A0A975K5J2_9SPHN|nr:hypothetical protein [Sphingobium phenoxybenzoativorans]QUT05189.1 hypothetical protein KFK14_19660 [Sphingobium phenoxybenzoativorans]